MADLTRLQAPEIIAITDANANGPVTVTVVGSASCLAVTGAGTFTVSVSNTPTVVANAGTGTFTVAFSSGTGTVTSNAGTGTRTVAFSTGTGTVVLSGNTNTVVGTGAFTVVPSTGTYTVSVSNTPAVTLSGATNTVVANAGSGTFTVLALAGTATATTGTITTATSAVTATVTTYKTVLVTVHGTYAGVTFGFNLSDDSGTTYYPVEAQKSDGSLAATSVTPGTNASAAYFVPVDGATTIQVLASAYTSGTANIRITPINGDVPLIAPNNIQGTVTVVPSTGTYTVSVSNTPAVTLSGGTNTVVAVGNLTHNNAAPAANNLGVLPAVASSAGPSYTAGDQVLLSVDTSGNLRSLVNLNQFAGQPLSFGQQASNASMPVVIASDQSAITTQCYEPAVVNGTITTATSTVTANTTTTTGCEVSIHGTYAGVNISFQVSDDNGTTYYPIIAARIDETGSETATGVLAANTSRMWNVYYGNVTNFRVAATAWTSGTATINISMTTGSDVRSVLVGGSVASAVADAGNPVKIGGVAYTAAPTTVTTGQRQNAFFDTMGRLMVTSMPRQTMYNASITLTATTTSTTLVPAAGAGYYYDLVSFMFSNSSATALEVLLGDGTINYHFWITAGGTLSQSFFTPVAQGSVNTAWMVQCETAVSSLYCNAQFVKTSN